MLLPFLCVGAHTLQGWQEFVDTLLLLSCALLTNLLWGYNMTIVWSRTAGRGSHKFIAICRLRVVCEEGGGTGDSLLNLGQNAS